MHYSATYFANVLQIRQRKRANWLFSIFIEDEEKLFDPDFSVQALADAVNVKYKTISEVIHEKWGCNFNTFVNTRRIREASKRIDSMKYDNLSMDAIMQGVGFRSRATFIAAFKKVTGLKPSEYQRIARERHRA